MRNENLGAGFAFVGFTGLDGLMRITNKTGNSVVAEEALVADSFSTRLRGLMFRLRFPKPILFVFPETSPKRNAIHSFFVFFEFDAVYLDEGKRVVEIHERVKPFVPYIEPKTETKYLIELEGGAVKENGIKLGDSLAF